MSHSRFIALVGGSGSGKSWLAAQLLAGLGPEVGLLSLDDFYHDLGHLPAAAREEVNFDDPAAIDWNTLREVLEGLEGGTAAQLPIYDFATHTRQAETRYFATARVIVLDGLWLLHHAWLREKIAFSVFVDCPEEERMRRRIERDVLTRGRTVASVMRQFANQVQPMHARFVEPQRQWATRRVHSPLSETEHAELLAACLAS
ncbi:MAG: uridine kinase [Verrucomicrobia bacterium]|nr:uridine kinase [Verrucomicrobiota bacterium]